MNNLKIRQAIERHRLKYYEVAKEIGISQFTFSVWLREEFTPEREQTVLKAIDSIVSEIQCKAELEKRRRGDNG